jgi:thymidylate synthase (FAD)
MTNSLIWAPTVFAMGQTQFNEEQFEAWLTFNGHNTSDMLADGATPLARLWDDVSEDDAIERMIEFGGRHCYRAWEQGRGRAEYIKNIIEMEHGSVLEHATINWAVQGVSRSLSLELARHRVGIALSQESQRYVDASDIQFVVPPLVALLAGGSMQGNNNCDVITEFHRHCLLALDTYKALQEMIVDEIKRKSPNIKSLTMIKKRANEAARAHLPNACETRFLWTTNMRLLRHFLWLRGGSGADLEIRRLAVELLHMAQSYAPSVFADMTTANVDDGYGVPIIVAAK